MPAPLLTRDARELRQLARPRWQRLLTAWAIPVAAGVLIGLHTSSVGPATCTAQDPCPPEPDASIYFGLLLSAMIAGLIFPRLAAWLAGGFVVGLIVSERLLRPKLISPTWLYLVDLSFVGLCALLGTMSRDRRPTDVAQQWLAGVRRERPPAGTDVPRLGRAWRSVAWLLWLLAAACLVWGWYAQQDVDAQQRVAARATAEVISHPDEFTVEVRLAGETAVISVYEARNYPVGSRMELYVDDRGLRQPVSEPYDASGWIFLGVLFAGTGWLCRARGVEKGNGPRMLFAEEQPITEVEVIPGVGRFAVYAGDARPGEPAIVEISTRPNVLRVDGDGEFRSTRPMLEPRQHAASLYGIPAPGHWCAIVVNGEVVMPTRPISARKVTAPPYSFDLDIPGEPSPSADLAPDAADLPLRPEEVEALRPSDRDLPPEHVRFHVRSPLIGYINAAALPVMVVPFFRFLPDLTYGVLALIAAVVVAVSCVIAWRLFMRARVAWNAHGVAVVGAIGYKRVPWRAVIRIEHNRHDVIVHTGYSSLVVGAGAEFGMFGRRDRKAEELANALRYARSAAQVGGDETSAAWHTAPGTPSTLEGLPTLEPPRAPVALYVFWLVYTPVVAWFLQIFPT